MFILVKELIEPFLHNKYLLSQLTVREIKARYKQSFVGYAWIIINPLSQLVVYSFVFSTIFKLPTSNVPYPLFIFSGLLPWIYVQTSVTQATMCLVENANLIRKVYFPREVLPYSIILSKFIDFFFAYLLLIPLMYIFGVSIQSTIVYIIPTLLLQIVLMTGMGLVFSSFNLFYRDVQYLINLMFLLWLYLTQVMYPVSLVPKQFLWVYYLNPMAGIIEAYRYALFGLPIDRYFLETSIIISLLIFIFGFYIFKKTEKVFADLV